MKISSTYLRLMQELPAWNFLDLIPRVLAGAQRVHGRRKSEFPVKPPHSPSLSPTLWHAHSDGDDWNLYRHGILYPVSRVLSRLLLSLRVTLRTRFQNWTPCSVMESRKAPWSLLHSQCGNAHPLLVHPPPSLSPQSVDHPETGSSFFVFLK